MEKLLALMLLLLVTVSEVSCEVGRDAKGRELWQLSYNRHPERSGSGATRSYQKLSDAKDLFEGGLGFALLVSWGMVVMGF